MLPWYVTPLCIVAGIALILSGIPLYLRRVPPNYFFGVRLPTTLHDEEIWYDVNARAGRDFVVIGTLYLAALGIAQSKGLHWDPALRILVPITVLVAGLIIESVVIVTLTRRLRRKHER